MEALAEKPVREAPRMVREVSRDPPNVVNNVAAPTISTNVVAPTISTNVAAPTISTNAVPPNTQEQTAGARSIRVELKRRTTAKKVQLHPKKVVREVVKTRKSRKVLLGVSAQHRQMTRAKKMHRAVKAMPLAQLREQLVKKGLIKATSKAPETVLRQMAADAQSVAAKAL